MSVEPRPPACPWPATAKAAAGLVWALLWLVGFEAAAMRWRGLERVLPPVTAPSVEAQVPVYCKIEALRRQEPRPTRLIVGSSRAHFGFAPAIIDEELATRGGDPGRTFNAGVFTAAADLTWEFLHVAQPFLSGVETIVYELAPFALNSDPGNPVLTRQEPGLWLLRRRWEPLPRKNAVERIGYALHPTYWWRLPLRSGVLRRTQADSADATLRLWGNRYLWPGPPPGLPLEAWDGWGCLDGPLPGLDVTSPDWQAQQWDRELSMIEPYELAGTQSARFVDTLRWCRGRGIRVVVVIMPVFPAYAERLFAAKAETYAAFREFVQRSCDAEGAELIDWCVGSAELPAEYFADFSHLDCEGARFVSRRLARRLPAPRPRRPRTTPAPDGGERAH